MKKISIFLTLVLLWIQPIFAKADPREGNWCGIVDFGLTETTMILHTTLDPSGAIKAKVDMLEYEFFGTRINTIIFEKGELKMLLGRSFYKGTLNPEGTEIVGLLTQNQTLYPLVFKREFSVEPPYKLQEPMPPYPYKEEEVSYDNQSAGITLSGTLTLPDSEGPFPAVILISSSGANDRDEDLKLFLVLADHLTRKGIAVLRFDKRGFKQSTGIYREATTLDFASDVLAGIEYLKTRKEIEQIGLIGYSEGGLIASMLAAQSKDVAFIVAMASPGVNGEELAYSQAELIQRAVGISEERIEGNLNLRRQLFGILKNEADPIVADPLLRQAIREYLVALPQDKKGLRWFRSIADFNESSIDDTCRVLNTKWLRFFLTYEPTDFFRQVTVPILVVNGELDSLVVPDQNLPLIERALRQAGNRNYKILELPKLNHLFQACETGEIGEYKKLREGISPIFLSAISDWLLSQICCTNPPLVLKHSSRYARPLINWGLKGD